MRVSLAVFFLVALALPGCGGTKTLSEEEAKQALRELPYRFEFQPVEVPEDADGAIGGVAYGPHGTVLRFGVSLGRGGDPVSLGPNSDLANATGGETFRVTTDYTIVVNGKLQLNPRIKTRTQSQTSASMSVALEDKLCRVTEGEPCAI